MSQLRHITRIILLAATLAACETEPILFKSGYHVRFTASELTLKESYHQTVQVEVHLAGPAQDEDVTVFYTVGGDAREGVDYTIQGTKGVVVIEAGKYFGYIMVDLINNSNNIIRSQDIEFTLNTADNSAFSIGQGTAHIGNKLKFTIVDDCILNGSYAGITGIFSIPKKGIIISSEDCENYRLSDWNVDIFIYPFPLGLDFVDNGDNTLTIPSQEQPEFPEDLATIQGVGSVNPLTREIYMTIKFVDFEEPNEVQITLKPE